MYISPASFRKILTLATTKNESRDEGRKDMTQMADNLQSFVPSINVKEKINFFNVGIQRTLIEVYTDRKSVV